MQIDFTRSAVVASDTLQPPTGCVGIAEVDGDHLDEDAITKQSCTLDVRIYNVYTYYVDVLYQYGGLKFVWSADKAVRNILKHDVRFEQACQVLLDRFSGFLMQQRMMKCVTAHLD